MPVNPTKQAYERWQAALKELEKRSKDLETDPSNSDKRSAFDAQLKAVDDLKAEYARFKDYEARMAEGRLDEDLQNPDRKTAEELAGMTEVERRSDRVNPLLNPDAKGYSLSRAIDLQAQGKTLSGIELEVSQELQRRNTRLGHGSRDGAIAVPMTLVVQLPRSLQTGLALGRLAGLTDRESRALNAASTGTAAIPTILDSTIIEMLRNKVIMNQAGATSLTGITGVFDMPKQSAQPSVTIGGESVTQAESAAQVATKVTFTPKTITGTSKVTRRFMVQAMASMDVENFLRMMLLNQIALGIDYEAINGPGGANRCTGLLQNGSVTTVALGAPDGGAPTWAKLVDLETNVADANADGNSMAYITNAKGRGVLKRTLKASAAGSTMLWENNTVNGYPALMSNQMPKNLTKGGGTNLSSMLFGDFSQLVIALWTGVDVLADPYTGGNEGATNLYAHQDFDLQVRYAEAFSKIVDMITT